MAKADIIALLEAQPHHKEGKTADWAIIRDGEIEVNGSICKIDRVEIEDLKNLNLKIPIYMSPAIIHGKNYVGVEVEQRIAVTKPDETKDEFLMFQAMLKKSGNKYRIKLSGAELKLNYNELDYQLACIGTVVGDKAFQIYELLNGN